MSTSWRLGAGSSPTGRADVPPGGAVSDCVPAPTRGLVLPRHRPMPPTEKLPVKAILEESMDSGYLSQVCSAEEIQSRPLSGGLEPSPLLYPKQNSSSQRQLVDRLGDQLEQSLTVSSQEELERRYRQTLHEAFSGDEDGDTHLHLAIIYGFREVASCLIRLAPHPQLLSLRNSYLQTPLHLAVLIGDAQLARQLVVAGVDLSSRDRHGNTPLHLACQQADQASLHALLQPVSVQESRSAHLRCPPFQPASSPPPLDAWNYQGLGCLHLAALSADLVIVAHLVVHGASVDLAEGKSGRTPLHLAVEAGNVEAVRFLVEAAGANVNALTYGSLSSYQLALLNARLDLAELLAELGATRADLPDSDTDMSSDSDPEGLLKPDQLYTDVRIGGRPLVVGV